MDGSPLVSTEWLQANLHAPDLVLLDASWHMPATGRDGALEFLQERIPGARFFDFDRRICDSGAGLPHMLPSPEVFAAEVRALGVGKHSRVVCYDSAGVFSSPRAWWMFHAMGHVTVAVLDGGLPAWKAAGLPLTSGRFEAPESGDFESSPVAARVADRAQVRAALADPGVVVLDARSPGRFAGRDPEPRAGLRAGHMPGARNLPFGNLLSAGRFRAPDELAALFAEQAGLQQRLLCTCGSGVTACVIALAAELAGRGGAAVYDGSWADWGARSDSLGCPVACDP